MVWLRMDSLSMNIISLPIRRQDGLNGIRMLLLHVLRILLQIHPIQEAVAPVLAIVLKYINRKRLKVWIKEKALTLNLAARTEGEGYAKDLAEKIATYGTDVHYFPSFDEIENFLLTNCKKNDLLITMGAGNVVNIGDNLLKG